MTGRHCPTATITAASSLFHHHPLYPTSSTTPLCRAEAERAAIEGDAEEEARLLEQARPKERRVKEEPGGFVDGDEEPEEAAAAAAADGDEEEDDDEEDDDGDELGYLHETTTQGGLAGALEMARGRGMLGADGPTSGRMFDQKGAGLHDYEADDGDGEGKAGYEGTRLGRGKHSAHDPSLLTHPASHTPLLPPPATASSSTISTSTAAR